LILLDTSGLFVALNPDEPAAEQMLAVLEADRGPYILSPFVLAELEYLVTRRARAPGVELQLLSEVARGTYDLAPFNADDVAGAASIVEKYRDLHIGLAEASIVVLAERYGTNRVLTLDERHFRALRVGRKRFVVLPADA